jgi:hypothetical protein
VKWKWRPKLKPAKAMQKSYGEGSTFIYTIEEMLGRYESCDIEEIELLVVVVRKI